MTPNTYHEEIPDQDVVNQLERMERKPYMVQTPSGLKKIEDMKDGDVYEGGIWYTKP